MLNGIRKDRNTIYNVLNLTPSQICKTREIEKSNKGRSLLQLLNEHGISYNQHLLHSKYRKYETLAQNNALQHLANNCF